MVTLVTGVEISNPTISLRRESFIKIWPTIRKKESEKASVIGGVGYLLTPAFSNIHYCEQIKQEGAAKE